MPRTRPVLAAAVVLASATFGLVGAPPASASALTSGGGCDNITTYAGGVRGKACIAVDARGVMESDGYFSGPAGCVVYAQAYLNGATPIGTAGPTAKLAGGTTTVHVPAEGDNSATGAVRGRTYKSRVRIECSSSNISTPSGSNSQVY